MVKAAREGLKYVYRSATGSNNELKAIEDEAKRLEEEAQYNHVGHNEEAKVSHRSHRWLGILAVLLAAAAGLTSFSTVEAGIVGCGLAKRRRGVSRVRRRCSVWRDECPLTPRRGPQAPLPGGKRIRRIAERGCGIFTVSSVGRLSRFRTWIER